MRYESNPMKTQLKIISCFVVMAFASGALLLSASLRAQTSTPDAVGTPSDPDANKKEAPASMPTSPTPSPSPRR